MNSGTLITTLQALLKRYDRIGFGRRGILDAESEVLEFGATLSNDERARLRGLVIEWLKPEGAHSWTVPLHYNLPEHLQALAMRLCGAMDIREALTVLREFSATRAFDRDETPLRREALAEALSALQR